MITTSVQLAIETLNQDEIVAIPTETVYGLAANVYSENAIKKVFSTKKRPSFNPLIVHISSVNELEKVAKNIPEKAYLLASAFWPGPLTLVLEKQPEISDLVTARKPTVGVRVPNHPVTLSLLSQLDFPVAAPSANPFTSISPTTSKHVFDYFQEEVKVILEGGDCEKGVESTIVGFDNNQVILYRYGAISVEEIESVVGEIILASGGEIIAPGMLKLHYAPKTKTIMIDDFQSALASCKGMKVGVLTFKDTFENTSDLTVEILSKTGSLGDAAKNLYAALHRLDANKLDIILIEKMPDIGLGKTINDRLLRAVSK